MSLDIFKNICCPLDFAHLDYSPYSPPKSTTVATWTTQNYSIHPSLQHNGTGRGSRYIDLDQLISVDDNCI